MVALLLSNGADLTLLKNGRFSALYSAVKYGHVGVVKEILAQRGELLNVRQPETPLYCASLWGCWKVVEYLIGLPGADPNERNEGGWTPLLAACDDGYVETVRVLLAHDADPNIPDHEEKMTALTYATGWNGDVEILRMLLEHGATVDHEILERPLLCDIANEPDLSTEDKIGFFETLIRHDPSLNIDKADADGIAPLMLAAMNGNVALIRWLLRRGSDINRTSRSGKHALFYAVEESHHTAAMELLKHDIPPTLDIQSDGPNSLLEAAVAEGDTSLVEILLDAGADMEFKNSNKQTVLSMAVYKQQTDVVKLLLERGVDVSNRDSRGWTPLLISIYYNSSTETLRLLVDSGANLNDRLGSPGDTSGPTALHLAMNNANRDKLRTLLEFHTSIDLNLRDAHGNTPLLAAGKWDSPQIVECQKLLVRAGADVNDTNSDGECLLMKSSYWAETASAVHDFLLSRPEIHVDTVSPKYGTPLQVACRNGHIQLVNKLIRRGADVNLAIPAFAPTALISACLPWDLYKEQNKAVEGKEWAVRELITHGAEANFMSKNSTTFTNALCAASFCGRVGIINFLLDSGASAQQKDPMGRLAIHFAAANGLRNFQAVALVYTGDIVAGDIVAGDKADKNALHWAAQFGHVETIKAILERLPKTKRNTLIDCRDKDGWTPLAFAMRPTMFTGDNWMSTTFSEKSDYAGTVQYLMELGADVSVTFRQGRENAAEELTLAELARRCGAAELAELVTPSENPEPNDIRASEGESSEVSSSRNIYGIIYMCLTCPCVQFCTKCYRSIELYHEHVIDDGQIHTFGIDAETGDREFVEPNPLPSTALLQEANSEEVTGIKAPVEDSDAADLNTENDDSRDDITEVVDFSDLKDLGSFTD
ncbi:hypothetical protein Daus18300_007511 [Diaporthe australafricana]|uniref:Ankyrin repeat protein n=1 Tax=Diaporthe australafricana TaxID=127596 RepID=A0ABR3WMG7_9PEZI